MSKARGVPPVSKLSRWDRWWLLPRAALALVAVVFSIAVHAQDFTDVTKAESAVIVIDGDAVIREQLPSTLFGFNINHRNFQQDLWQEDLGRVNPIVTEALQPLPGALYRYPGGLVANRFWWEQAIGPAADRQLQRSVNWEKGTRVSFGVEEYLDFVHSVGGVPWYVLNLVGWDSTAMIKELDVNVVAKSNAELAKFIGDHTRDDDFPHYYQLGNELDRADYQWSHEKYVQRARRSMDAIRAVDADARFVAFLRDFDWTYTGGERDGTVSRYQDLIADVLRGLPDVNDFSLHFYYDDYGVNRAAKQIPWRLAQFRRAMAAAAAERGGKTPNVWITEHARGVNAAAGQTMKRAAYTSNLAGAISASDFLIALAQIPEIQGAAWHGLNAGPWQVFDATVVRRDLSPRPIYYALRVLKAAELPVVLGTRTRSPNFSGYGGGYDIRSAALTEPNGEQLALWVINRAPRAVKAEVQMEAWGGRAFDMRHYYVAGSPGVDPDDLDLEPVVELDPKPESGRFSPSGSLTLQLPPASVSSFILDSSISRKQD